MILHVDMDAFYAAVEQRDQPALQGQPVVVGHAAAGRGVVAAASYEARRFGIHSAMPTATARRLCPHAVFIKPRMDHYAEISAEIRTLLHEVTPVVEPLALDEAFLDVGGVESLFGPAAEIGRALKHRIRDQVGLVASVGVAPVKFVAKIASDLDKPDGLVVVPDGQVQAFLDPLPVARIWGVGRRAQTTLGELGVHRVAQLRLVPNALLKQRFGAWGAQLHQLAHGIDPRPVTPDAEARSLSHETTFASDIASPDVLEAVLMRLTEQVARRLRAADRRARTLQIKVRSSDFRTITRSTTLDEATDVTQELWLAARRLLIEKTPGDIFPVRLLGVGVSHFQARNQQELLFDAADRQRHRALDAAADEIVKRFGDAGIVRARRLDD